MIKPKLYIIAGCNGAGKTTASFAILPEVLNCLEFVNADEIAKGLSPFQPEKVAIDAGRIMLRRINELVSQKETFAFETTLSTKSYKNLVKKAKDNGYEVILLFFWLTTVELAIERVKQRVFEGGHAVAPGVITRRYRAGIRNLFQIYLPIVDAIMIFDNSDKRYQLIFEKYESDIKMYDEVKFNLLKDYIL